MSLVGASFLCIGHGSGNNRGVSEVFFTDAMRFHLYQYLSYKHKHVLNLHGLFAHFGCFVHFVEKYMFNLEYASLQTAHKSGVNTFELPGSHIETPPLYTHAHT